VDGQAALFRDTGPTAPGVYAKDSLLEFLKRQQGRNDVVDVIVRVMAENGRSAVRLVHIPPSVRMEQYRLRIQEIESADRLLRAIRLISLALDEGMWSRAAQEARRVLELTPGVPELREYALAGLCQSDFEEEKSRLRGELGDVAYERVCPAAASTVVTSPVLPRVVARTGRANLSRVRLGIALLIGNSDYWNLPLKSVKSDIKHMGATLQAMGFEVRVRENLRDPRQFQEALVDVLKKENAGPEDLLLLYYSGHGLQLDGKAHLLGTGVSATPRVADDLRSSAQSAEGLLAEMERAAPGTRILIVEACRSNVLSGPSVLGGQSPRAGFAFQQDDVPNTFVMFADRPGLPTPVRSDYGLMGPFTESFIYALDNSSGEIQEAFALAQKKTTEISPGQQPVLYTSKRVERVVLRQQEERLRINRAAELLNAAEVLYRSKAWDQFLWTVSRARALASDSALEQRLGREVEFGRLAILAEKYEEARNWKEAAVSWQKASDIFPARPWLAMNAAVAWLIADRLEEPVQILAGLSVQAESKVARDAKQILREILKAFPELESTVLTRTKQIVKVPTPEFELVGTKE
jgi:hypothetical protein